MNRTGVMAPPDLYDLPTQHGLMTVGARAEALEPSLRSFLWCVALVLALVELCVEMLTG
jgi:hypothetical protein